MSKMANEVWIYADVVCDLFHYGHVEFLRRARLLGTHLVVGVVGDDDVATYKAPPVLTHAERVAVVRGCRFVDRVLDAPSPLYPSCDFLDHLGAAFLCHGDDMGPQELERWYGGIIPSGRLRTVGYTSAISTRKIVERVAQRLRERGDDQA